MDNMIERVARAIAAARGLDWERLAENKRVHPYPHSPLTVTRECIRDEARAAIETMREPSEAMLAAYDGALKAHIESVPEAERTWKTRRIAGGKERGHKIKPSEKAQCRWQAMIDAARAE